jgi:hypothetical protein
VNISDVRQKVRGIIGDNQESSRMFADSALDSHIRHAAEIFSRYLPPEDVLEMDTVPGSREVELPPEVSCASLRAVEWPLGLTQPEYASFTCWAGKLILLSGREPDGSRSGFITPGTIPSMRKVPHLSGLREPACHRAAALATFEEAFRTTNGLTRRPGNQPEIPRMAQENLDRYCVVLKRLSRIKSVRTTRLARW